MAPIKLDIGGAAWSGWTFGPYGRARDWRLTAPSGETFTAGDLLDARPLALDVDYLRSRVRELEALIERDNYSFSEEEAAALRAAADILARTMPAPQLKREPMNVPAGQ